MLQVDMRAAKGHDTSGVHGSAVSEESCSLLPDCHAGQSLGQTLPTFWPLAVMKSQCLQVHSCRCCGCLQDSGVAAVSAPVSPSLYSTCLSRRMGPT